MTLKCIHCNFQAKSLLINREQAIGEITTQITKHLIKQHPQENQRLLQILSALSAPLLWLITLCRGTSFLEDDTEIPGNDILTKAFETQMANVAKLVGIPEEDKDDEEGDEGETDEEDIEDSDLEHIKEVLQVIADTPLLSELPPVHQVENHIRTNNFVTLAETSIKYARQAVEEFSGDSEEIQITPEEIEQYPGVESEQLDPNASSPDATGNSNAL